MIDIAVLMGVDRTIAEENFKDVLEFELRLIKVRRDKSYRLTVALHIVKIKS